MNKKYICVVMSLLLLFTCVMPVSASEHSTDAYSNVTYTCVDHVISETVTIYEYGKISSVIRRDIHPNGTIDLYVNGSYSSSLASANYDAFLQLVGTSTNYFNDLHIEFRNFQLNRSSNYGCGHNDKIHIFLYNKSKTFSNSDILNWGSAIEAAGILLLFYEIPYGVLVALAGVIVNRISSDVPDQIYIQYYEYDVFSINNLYLFTCHHFFISYYRYALNPHTMQFDYMLDSTDSYYTQSSRLT